MGREGAGGRREGAAIEEGAMGSLTNGLLAKGLLLAR